MRNTTAILVITALLLLPASGRSQAPAGPRPAGVLQLSLPQAVAIALGPDGNARARIAEEIIRQAEARSHQFRAALLPNVDASLSEQSMTRNLAAFGIRLQIPIPGFNMPTFVGPFNVFDARATASQSVFDLSAIRRFQASRTGVQQAEAEQDSAQDQVRDQVARAYLAALRADAGVRAAEADSRLADAVLKLATDQKETGTGTGIEVTRARVQLANARQRLLAAGNDATKSRLQLLRVIGLAMDSSVQLTDELSFLPVASGEPAQLLKTALESRADYRAQQKREQAARLNSRATTLERVPAVSVFGDYGSIGTSMDNALPTRTIGVMVRIPVFDGGRRDARRAEFSSLLRQELIRTRDLRIQIDMEIRVALESLASSAEQLKAADEGLALAADEVAHAQRRYENGFGSSIELTDAQTRLSRARENRILALYGYNVARIDLNTAMGTIRNVTQ
jgi:outer membrane protein